MYNIELTKEHWQLIIEGLGELPLKKSGPVYEQVVKQLDEQMKQETNEKA